MKTILLFLVISMLFVGVEAQTDSLSAQTADLKQIQYDSIIQIIESKQFVLEADFLRNIQGGRIRVQSGLNFVKVDSSHSVIQSGSATGFGRNGVGGLTADGTINKWKIEENDKKKSLYVEMSVNSNIGIFDIFMNINYKGEAFANITGLRYNDKVEFEGKIAKLEESNMYKGYSH